MFALMRIGYRELRNGVPSIYLGGSYWAKPDWMRGYEKDLVNSSIVMNGQAYVKKRV